MLKIDNINKNVLITGCAGFIGSHTADLFLDKGHNVVGVDCLTYASSVLNMDKARQYDNFTFIKENICNTRKIKDVCKNNGIEWIINFAAESHVDNSIDDISPFIKSNIQGMSSILDVCREMGIKILQISTDEVYGSSATKSFNENDKLDPRNPYSASKAAAEHLVTSYHNTYGITHKIVRMSNNFGPRQHDEKLLPTAVKSLAFGKSVPIYGDGKNIRDWFYVKDCALMIYDVLLKGEENEVYNLTYNNEIDNIELINMVCNIMEKDPATSIKFVEDRPGHDFRYSICNDKIKEVGIESPTDFYYALSETVNSLLKRLSI